MQLIRVPSQSQQVAEHIAREINTGKIVPGQRMESIRRLAQQFQVGRQVIHSAVQQLEKMGMVCTECGRGTFVNPEFRANPERLRLGFYIHDGDLSTAYNHTLFAHCCRYGNQLGHDVLLGFSPDGKVPDTWMDNLDGLLVTGVVDDTLVEYLNTRKKPYLICGNYDLRQPANVYCVDLTGNIRRVLQAAWLKLQPRSLGVITGPLRYHSTKALLQELRDFAAARNLICRDEYCICDDREDGYEPIRRLLALPEPPDLVFLTLDTYSGVLRYLCEHNLTAKHLHPQLITVSYCYEQILFRSLPAMVAVYGLEDFAEQAVNGLVRLIHRPEESPSVKMITVPIQLVAN